MIEQRVPEKLVIMIVASNDDSERLMQTLVQEGMPATRVGSAGGFLRRGSSTIFSGVPAAEVERLLTIVRRTCPVRTELAPVQTLPLVGVATGASEPVEVRTGGAIVFVVDIERFERI
ncbi:MAG: cyclic-di-AMP receptor [Dehalococcoidia bacterium]